MLIARGVLALVQLAELTLRDQQLPALVLSVEADDVIDVAEPDGIDDAEWRRYGLGS